jgi:putative endonuclease
MAYFIYILKCKDGTLYTGITTDVVRRFEEHKAGKGGAYTRARGAMKILYKEKSKDRSSASKREVNIKKLSRKEKLKLILSIKTRDK